MYNHNNYITNFFNCSVKSLKSNDSNVFRIHLRFKYIYKLINFILSLDEIRNSYSMKRKTIKGGFWWLLIAHLAKKKNDEDNGREEQQLYTINQLKSQLKQ